MFVSAWSHSKVNAWSKEINSRMVAERVSFGEFGTWTAHICFHPWQMVQICLPGHIDYNLLGSYFFLWLVVLQESFSTDSVACQLVFVQVYDDCLTPQGHS